MTAGTEEMAMEANAPKISLAAARVNAELTQEEAARRLGCTAKTLAQYEKGIVKPNIKILQKLEATYGFPLENIRL